jgi:hypothetical protein
MAAAAKQRASLSAKWMVALQSLKAVPGAAADRSLPKKTLHYMASQAEVDCTCAEYNRTLNPNNIDWCMLQSSPQLEPVLDLVVNKLQVCAPIKIIAGERLDCVYYEVQAGLCSSHCVQSQHVTDHHMPNCIACMTQQLPTSHHHAVTGSY